jgi:putative acetyltransferase
MLTIRPETTADHDAVRHVTMDAFGQPLEANLIDALRRAAPRALSLVAEDEGGIVGHILFTPVTIETSGRRVEGMGLAPMAVASIRQRQGIGTQLVERGLAILREQGCPFVVVVGHPAYYPRFGFTPASAHGLDSQWPGMPDEAFMVLVLDEDAMNGVSGVARYLPEFDEVV